MVDKIAAADYPIHELLARRWSPYAFEDRMVSREELCSLFEAARWAPSSFNEQPWSFLVALRDEPDPFQRLLSCLTERNQIWAKAAPVLVLGLVSVKLAKNGKDNRAAVHDLGLASANLVLEATSRGLFVHQMIGIYPDKVRELYGIPEGVEAWTGMAIGYKGDPRLLPQEFHDRELKQKPRKPLSAFVFSGIWGEPSPWLKENRDG